MRSSTSRLSFKKVNKKIQILFPLVVFLSLNMLSGCANLYKIESAKGTNTVDTLTALKNRNKEFIIHFKEAAFVVDNFLINENKLEGELSPLNSIQHKYVNPKSRSKNPYEKRDSYSVFNAVHLYAAGNPASDTAFSIPVSAITRIDINQENIDATRRSHLVEV